MRYVDKDKLIERIKSYIDLCDRNKYSFCSEAFKWFIFFIENFSEEDLTKINK